MRGSGEPGEEPTGVRNEFSGVADTVVQVGRLIGDVVISLPPVPARPAGVPRQVPAADRHFANRTAELARLAGVDPPGASPRISVLTGMRGVGKTALARRVAEVVGSRFDGDLFVDYRALRFRVGHEAAAGEAQLALLRDLGVADVHMPTSKQERDNLFRSLTSDRRLLVVLDDVTEARQVRDLVPRAPGSAVLATSDHRIGELIHFDGAELVVLDPLGGADARQVLVSVCGADRIHAEPPAVGELIDLCDGLPLALRIAAARLVVEPAMTVGELVAEVRQGLDALSLDGQDGVEAVLAAAHRALPPDAARLYQIAGSVPGLEFTTELAGTVLELSTREARTALGALRAANLVEDRPGRRCRLFGLVGRHAATVAEPDERIDAVLARLADYYVLRAVSADYAIMGADRLRLIGVRTSGAEDPFGGGPGATALAWMSDERVNLMAVLRLCATRGWHERACQLAEALAALYLNRRSPYDLIDSCDLGARAAIELARVDVQARMQAVASRGELDLDRLDAAARRLELAVSLAERSENLLLLASVWEFRGRYFEHVDSGEAEAAYRMSREVNLRALESGDSRGRRGSAIATFFLGGCLDRLGRHDEALAELRDAFDRLRALGDERMAARALAAIGDVHAGLRRDPEAAEALLEAVRLLAALGTSHYEAQALETLAEVAERLGDHDAAQRSLARAVEILAATGSPRAEELRGRLSPDG